MTSNRKAAKTRARNRRQIAQAFGVPERLVYGRRIDWQRRRASDKRLRALIPMPPGMFNAPRRMGELTVSITLDLSRWVLPETEPAYGFAHETIWGRGSATDHVITDGPIEYDPPVGGGFVPPSEAYLIHDISMIRER